MLKLLLIALLVYLLLISSSLPQNIFDCGVPQVVNDLIVNGYNTVQGAWPWHVAIFSTHGKKEQYICGGTLVTGLHVITAKHCLQNAEGRELLPANETYVKLGVYQLNSMSREVQLRMIREIYSADNFSTLNLRNDIAILELVTEAEFGKYVQPACISLTNDLTGQLGTVVGWGIDESNRISAVLKSAQLPVIDVHTCLASSRAVFGTLLDEGSFCAGYTNGTAVCNGDSGGGIFFEENGAWYLGGIISFSQFRKDGSKLCSTKGYTGFTKIHTYLAWIRTVTKLELDMGHYESQDIDTDAHSDNRLPRDCGTNTIQGGVRRYDPNVLEFPWMAILLNQYAAPVCVGSLIHKRYVLTTGFCTFYDTSVLVQLGNPRVTWWIYDPTRDYGVEYVVRHPNNTLDSYASMQYDISLIRLNRDVIIGDKVRPICLPVTEFLKNLALPQYFVTSPDTTNGYSILLNDAVTDKDCLRNSLKVFCIETKDYSTCQLKQSIGSILGYNVQHNGERFVQFGIVSEVVHCNQFAVVNMTKHIDWILASIIP